MSLKNAAKVLMRSAAKDHNISGKELMRAFRKSNELPGSNLSNFYNLLRTGSEAIESGEFEIHSLTQAQIDSYTFLYHFIDNIYIREVEAFEELSFYPRIEDLFNKKTPKLVIADSVKPEPEPNADVQIIVDAEIPWNLQQRKAFKKVFKWLRNPNRPQIFRLFGWAGTGKTVMSKKIAAFMQEEAGKQDVPVGGVLFAAYSGKACSVLRTKGCRGASTLHSLLYKPLIDPDTGRCAGFIRNSESPLAVCGLLIVDEVSMVNEEMAKDIMSFGCSILVLGDPEQLPPVEGVGYFTDHSDPDIMLTDVERQAKENPIIWLATRVRKRLELKPGKYGDSVVYDEGKYLDPEYYLTHDQILCGTNNTRMTINKKVRRNNGLAKLNALYPVHGDKLICLKNNKLKGLYNGTMWRTTSAPFMRKIQQPVFKGAAGTRTGSLDVFAFEITSIDERDADGKPYVFETQCSPHYFDMNLPEPAWRDLAGSEHFDFGDCITTHKSQGSQWASTLIIDESSVFRDMRYRHRYTGITRASERVTILL